MSTSTATAPTVNPTPPVVRQLPFGLVVLDITTAKGKTTRTDRYFVERIDCDDLAYTLTKTDPARVGTDRESDAYAVNLTMDSCDCKGHYRWGHCKHVEALALAYEGGQLP
jgi:hypothetical protein